MADHEVTFARSARRELEALDPPVVARVITRIESLAREPRPAGSRKLQGAQDLWRVRVGDYRIVYAVNDKKHTVDIVRVRHRRDAYR